MKLNATWGHALATIIFCAGGILHFMQTNPQIDSEVHMTANGLLVFAFLLAMATQAIFGTTTPPAPTPLVPPGGDAGKKDPVNAAADALKPPAAHRGMLRAAAVGLVSAVVVAAAVMLAGCPAAAPAVGPAANCASIVIADALKGMTLAQIFADAGPSCGNDLAQIVTELLGSTDPNVTSSKGYVDAVRLKSVLVGASK
ncbi:MAG: hypothetical protein ACYDDA_05245 [Acidiferrobacteraceae bacterium]